MSYRLSATNVDYRGLAHMAVSMEFFAPLKGNDLEIALSRIQLYEYAPGEALFKPGEPANAIFILYRGKVRLTLRRSWLSLFHKRVELEPGSLFGEMALLEGRAHSAWAVAEQTSSVFVLLKPDFQALIKNSPPFAEHMNWLAARRHFENRR